MCIRDRVEVVLLDVLAVVSLRVRQAEHTLFQDRVLSIPERQREADPHLVVADAEDPVLSPAIGPRACLIVGEVVPGVAIRTIVLSNSAPLPLAEVRAPA